MSFGSNESQSQTSQEPYQYGEMPGVFDTGGQLNQLLSGWLRNLGIGQTAPGLAQAGKAWGMYYPMGQQAGGAMSKLLSPEWMEKSSPGLQASIDALRPASQKAGKNIERDLRMEFGGAGQGMSSAKLGALGGAKFDASNRLESQIAQMMLGDYWNRLGAQQAVAGSAYQMPLGASQNYSQQANAFLQQVLQYILGGRGGITPLTSSTSSGSGWNVGMPQPHY